MSTSGRFLNPSQAAERLGVSTKALRLYEQHGLLKPIRTAAGWRADTVAKVRTLRADLAQGKAPTVGELARLVRPASEVRVAFDLPWPWGGERFELRDIGPLNYIIGPLGSGKT